MAILDLEAVALFKIPNGFVHHCLVFAAGHITDYLACAAVMQSGGVSRTAPTGRHGDLPLRKTEQRRARATCPYDTLGGLKEVFSRGNLS